MKRRITLDLDEELLGAIDSQADRVEESRARFIVDAVKERISTLERHSVDAEFEEMARDAGRSAEMRAIDRELDPSSDAAWRLLDPSKAASPRPRAKKKASRGAR